MKRKCICIKDSNGWYVIDENPIFKEGKIYSYESRIVFDDIVYVFKLPSGSVVFYDKHEESDYEFSKYFIELDKYRSKQINKVLKNG